MRKLKNEHGGSSSPPPLHDAGRLAELSQIIYISQGRDLREIQYEWNTEE